MCSGNDVQNWIVVTLKHLIMLWTEGQEASQMCLYVVAMPARMMGIEDV